MPVYKEISAMHPRVLTDTFFINSDNKYRFNENIDKSVKFIEDFQLLDSELWHRFVCLFRSEDSDFDNGWKGEFWGKMMRGAALTYFYTGNEALFVEMKKTVEEMMESADETGRISTYAIDHEFNGWDIWSRKYVLLGMQYFIEICSDDKFNKRIISSMKKQVDYIISKIGAEEGKQRITSAATLWRGMNSSSLLEPIVRLYNLTGEQKYLDFATYIIEEGGTDIFNVFDYAYENKFRLYEYPVTKAYETISCFEGALEYYRITGIEKYKTAAINFADRILEDDFTIIGCSGCTHELFDHSTVRQANTTNGSIQQESCVTVTVMKFMHQIALLTGDPKYADAFEISMYNAYLGSINTNKVIDGFIKKEHPECIKKPMPFDSYSPLTADVRGKRIGGFQIMSDKSYYGCCACIGAAPCGLIPQMAVMDSKDGIVINLFIGGVVETKTLTGSPMKLLFDTKYPKFGNVKITVCLDKPERFKIKVRNPKWSKNTKISVSNTVLPIKKGYIEIDREWKNGDIIELDLDMRTEVIRPIPYGSQIIMNKVFENLNYVVSTFDEEDPLAKSHIALRRGPIILAQENRLGYSVDEPIDILINDDGYVDAKIPKKDIAPYDHIVEVEIPLADGKSIALTDYGSAGKTWDETSKMAAWLLIK